MSDSLEPRILRKAGLVYVSDQDPGLTRHRRGRGFCYKLPSGDLLSDEQIRQRIKALGIPPAYRDVWICTLENGHLQATGLDDRGRKQYRYHADWQALRDERKYHELQSFGEALPRIRRKARLDSERTEDSQTATLAALVLLLDAAHLRVGNSYYLETNGTYGATTLLKRHLSFDEGLELKFTAKGGRRVRHKLRVPRLQRILERIADLPGRKLFVWQDSDGDIHPVDSGQLNRYLCDISGVAISAKTFRTWGGTVAAFGQAAEAIGRDEKPTVKSMSEAAAAELSNTPAVSRKSYIHPKVLQLASDPELATSLTGIVSTPQRPRQGLRSMEQRLMQFLSD